VVADCLLQEARSSEARIKAEIKIFRLFFFVFSSNVGLSRFG